MWFKSFFQRVKTLFLAESWIDPFIQWLHNLPLPYWLTCIITGFLPAIIIARGIREILVALGSGTEWTDLITVAFSIGIFPSYGLFMLWLFEKDRKELVNKFNISAANPQYIRMISVFWNLFWRILFVFGTSFLILFALIVNSLALWITLAIPAELLIANIFWLLLIKIIKTLSAIYNLRNQFTNINLFNLSPIYQLPQITQRIALSFIYLGVFIELLVFRSIVTRGGILNYWNTGVLFDRIFLSIGIILILIAGLVFVSPVLWIRKRIISVKDSTLAELDEKLQLAFENLDQAAAGEDYTKVTNLKGYADALISRKEFIKKISEWPWEGRIFREFFAAILVPLLLWLIQLVLTRWLNK